MFGFKASKMQQLVVTTANLTSTSDECQMYTPYHRSSLHNRCQPLEVVNASAHCVSTAQTLQVPGRSTTQHTMRQSRLSCRAAAARSELHLVAELVAC
jgi:hypothetical protein